MKYLLMQKFIKAISMAVFFLLLGIILAFLLFSLFFNVCFAGDLGAPNSTADRTTILIPEEDLKQLRSRLQELESKLDTLQSELKLSASEVAVWMVECDKAKLKGLEWKAKYYNCLKTNREIAYRAKCYKDEDYVKIRTQLNDINSEIEKLSKTMDKNKK